jgi:hypothetical protein
MPKLKKLKPLRNIITMMVPRARAPQVHRKKRKIAEVEKENVSTRSSQSKIITHSNRS